MALISSKSLKGETAPVDLYDEDGVLVVRRGEPYPEGVDRKKLRPAEDKKQRPVEDKGAAHE